MIRPCPEIAGSIAHPPPPPPPPNPGGQLHEAGALDGGASSLPDMEHAANSINNDIVEDGPCPPPSGQPLRRSSRVTKGKTPLLFVENLWLTFSMLSYPCVMVLSYCNYSFVLISRGERKKKEMLRQYGRLALFELVSFVSSMLALFDLTCLWRVWCLFVDRLYSAVQTSSRHHPMFRKHSESKWFI